MVPLLILFQLYISQTCASHARLETPTSPLTQGIGNDDEPIMPVSSHIESPRVSVSASDQIDSDAVGEEEEEEEKADYDYDSSSHTDQDEQSEQSEQNNPSLNGDSSFHDLNMDIDALDPTFLVLNSQKLLGQALRQFSNTLDLDADVTYKNFIEQVDQLLRIQDKTTAMEQNKKKLYKRKAKQLKASIQDLQADKENLKIGLQSRCHRVDSDELAQNFMKDILRNNQIYNDDHPILKAAHKIASDPNGGDRFKYIEGTTYYVELDVLQKLGQLIENYRRTQPRRIFIDSDDESDDNDEFFEVENSSPISNSQNSEEWTNLPSAHKIPLGESFEHIHIQQPVEPVVDSLQDSSLPGEAVHHSSSPVLPAKGENEFHSSHNTPPTMTRDTTSSDTTSTMSDDDDFHDAVEEEWVDLEKEEEKERREEFEKDDQRRSTTEMGSFDLQNQGIVDDYFQGGSNEQKTDESEDGRQSPLDHDDGWEQVKHSNNQEEELSSQDEEWEHVKKPSNQKEEQSSDTGSWDHVDEDI
eukprot:g1171.t1